MWLKLALSGELIFSTDIVNSSRERLSIKGKLRSQGCLCLQVGQMTSANGPQHIFYFRFSRHMVIKVIFGACR